MKKWDVPLPLCCVALLINHYLVYIIHTLSSLYLLATAASASTEAAAATSQRNLIDENESE